MADAPAIERGPTGDPMQPSLPQGEATQLAAEQAGAPTEAPTPQQGAPAEAQPLPPDAFSVETPPPPTAQATSDEERYLLAPPRQGEPTQARGVPNSAGGGLGLLDEAAQDPTAPPQVALLRNLIADQLGQ